MGRFNAESVGTNNERAADNQPQCRLIEPRRSLCTAIASLISVARVMLLKISQHFWLLLTVLLSALLLIRFLPFLKSVFVDNIRPNLFSGLEQLGCFDRLHAEQFDSGRKQMAAHNVVIAGITRDNAWELPTTIKYIERTGAFFNDYRVLVIENDSTDNTKSILHDWQSGNDKVRVISKDYLNNKRPSIAFLAEIRNQYLTELDTNVLYAKYDMLMVVDMDMLNGWDMRGLWHSFSEFSHWEAVCSNGVFTPSGRMFDMFAFRDKLHPQNVTHPHYWTRLVPVGQKVYPVGTPLLPVYSCFGGLAFYKRVAIQGCRYSSVDDDCEHVAFHRCLTERHFRLVMNPSQVLRYFNYKYYLLARYLIVSAVLALIVWLMRNRNSR